VSSGKSDNIFWKNLKKDCSDGEYEQLFFKYFPILIFEKMGEVMSSAQMMSSAQVWD
jgi:hypothetical protein